MQYTARPARAFLRDVLLNIRNKVICVGVYNKASLTMF